MRMFFTCASELLVLHSLCIREWELRLCVSKWHKNVYELSDGDGYIVDCRVGQNLH